MPSGIAFAEYVRYDATGLAALVQAGEIEAIDLVDAAIARAESVNPKINAIVERLYEQARASALLPSTGPFAGVPWAVKDLYHAIGGVRLTNGSALYRGHIAEADSELVARFRKAGLIAVCTSTTPEFGLAATTESKLHGLTRNPWDLSRSSGGSSGGAAALVAAGVMPAAHATDGGGSIRTPASCCGLVGLKVSRGRTPVGVGRTESWNGLGVSHALTRSVRDSAALLDATHGPAFGARSVAPPSGASFIEATRRAPRRLRIALQFVAPSGALPSAECVEAVRKAAQLCESLGHQVEEARPAIDNLGGYLVNVLSVHTAAVVAERSTALGRPIGDGELENVTAALAAHGRKVSGLDMVAADAAFMRAAIDMARFQALYDVILTPTLAALPAALQTISLDRPLPEFEREVFSYSPYSALYNITGQPAISLPLHWSAEGLPVGVQFAARIGEEDVLLALAAQLEEAEPWFHRRPTL
ncbi:MAG: amidase [Solimonas sp.]